MANIYDMADTWNDAGITFTAIKINVTDTASNAASLLMDLQVGGVSKFKVDKTGLVEVDGTPGNNGFYAKRFASLCGIKNSTGSLGLVSNGIQTVLLATSALRLLGTSGTNGYLTFSNSEDVRVYRDAANTLAQRNGANPQAFNLYNTYTDATIYERGFMRWNNNVLEIGTEAAGGGSDREIGLRRGSFLCFRTSGTSRLDIGYAQIIIGASFNGNGLKLNNADSNNTFQFSASRLEFSNATTVSGLASIQRQGMIARVTDGDSGLTHGQTVVNSGAGATPYLVWYNGTNWTVIGA